LFPDFDCSWTPYIRSIQFQELLPAGTALLTISERCKKTQQCILCPQAEEYTVVYPTKSKDFDSWADCIDGFIRVVKRINGMHNVPLAATAVPALVVRENAASGSINSPWLVINHGYLDTYWTVY
jgi:hypothetical protein